MGAVEGETSARAQAGHLASNNSSSRGLRQLLKARIDWHPKDRYRCAVLLQAPDQKHLITDTGLKGWSQACQQPAQGCLVQQGLQVVRDGSLKM